MPHKRYSEVLPGLINSPIRKGRSEEEFNRCSQTALSVATDKTTDYILVLCLENSDRDVDRKALLGPTNETVELAREVHKDYGNFGILLDEGHFPLMKEDPEKSLEMAKGLLTHIHMGNCYSKNSSKSHFGDKHLAFGIPDSDVGLDE